MKRLWLMVAMVLLLSACGGNSTISTQIRTDTGGGGTGGGGDSGGTTPGAAQGVYRGTYSFGQQFYAIVLPNDMYYAIDGYTGADGSMNEAWVLKIGKGMSYKSRYMADLTHFFSGMVLDVRLTASYVPAANLTGSVQFTQTGAMHGFSAISLGSSALDFDAAADLSHIVGTWTGHGLCDPLVGGSEGGCDPYTATIGAGGEFRIVGEDCISGTVAPDASNKNFFTVKVVGSTTSPCYAAGQTGSGIAVEMLMPDGKTRQLLLAAVLSDRPVVLAAQR